MAQRLIRDELLESDRWLALAHTVERLAYVVLLLAADDLGCLEATDAALVRRWRDPCQVKGREDALKILGALVEVDLVRTYEVGGKRFLFIPRFRQRFRARALKFPPPPPELTKDEPWVQKNVEEIQSAAPENARHLRAHASNSRANARLDVGVGVVVGEGVKDYVALARDILAFLNEKTGRAYRPVAANLDLITARLRDGATAEELRQVVAKKAREWSGDAKMAEYLRPATLFNRTKFAQYQGELVVEARGTDALPGM